MKFWLHHMCSLKPVTCLAISQNRSCPRRAALSPPYYRVGRSASLGAQNLWPCQCISGWGSLIPPFSRWRPRRLFFLLTTCTYLLTRRMPGRAAINFTHIRQERGTL